MNDNFTCLCAPAQLARSDHGNLHIAGARLASAVSVRRSGLRGAASAGMSKPSQAVTRLSSCQFSIEYCISCLILSFPSASTTSLKQAH